MHKWLSAKETTCTIFQWGISLFSHWWFLREPRIIPPWDLHVPFTCIIGSPAILFLAIMLHNVCFILHLSLHKWCQEKNSTGKTAEIESQNTFVCERAERAIFGVFNSFTVEKVSFFTINVKFKVILYSKSGGGGDVCTGHPPPHQKSGGDTSPHPPGFTPVYVGLVNTNVLTKLQYWKSKRFWIMQIYVNYMHIFLFFIITKMRPFGAFKLFWYCCRNI